MIAEPPPGLMPPPRIVKPRTRARKLLPVTAIVGDDVLSEAGEILTLDELVTRLPDMPRTIFATTGAPDLLAYFDELFSVSHPNSWQWRASDQERRADLKRPDLKLRHAVNVTIAVHWFGFRGKGHDPTYHRLIDPVTMYGQRLSKICPGDAPLAVRILHWAVTLRDFCAAQNLEVRPTMGGISAQLLTDARFYPRARRKVPTSTNERVRENLPGNHYKLNVIPSPERDYRATYIDQHRAHHYHASLIHFPHADHLYAYGYFHKLEHYYREGPTQNFMGMYCLDLVAPRHGKHYSWLTGLEKQFVFTNELPHLYDMGYTVTGVRAAWGSHHRDAGLNRLATWAMLQLNEYHDAPWLKPLLLSAYGTLAMRPTYGEAVFRQAKRGIETLMLTGKRSLTGLKVQRPRKLEPGFVNVLHRGMIEAATRSESIGLAQHLENRGQRVLSIYADAVITETDDDRPLPLLPEPWEVKKTLNHYQPIDLQAFTSDGMTKLPGINREAIPYRQASPGHAPRRVMFDALTGHDVLTERRI